MLGALIIVFREVIEAGLIVGIVMAATRGVLGRGRVEAAQIRESPGFVVCRGQRQLRVAGGRLGVSQPTLPSGAE